MILPKTTTTSEKPIELNITRVGNNVDIVFTDINTLSEYTEKIDGVDAKMYSFSYYSGSGCLTAGNEYKDLTILLIRLKYDVNDEIGLINDNIIEPGNAEYAEYRNYVSWCKDKAYSYCKERGWI